MSEPEGERPEDLDDAPPEAVDEDEDIRYFFDESLTGRPCTCEGGAQIEGTNYAGRVTYRGVLTGRRFEQGDPPWRWLETGRTQHRRSQRTGRATRLVRGEFRLLRRRGVGPA